MRGMSASRAWAVAQHLLYVVFVTFAHLLYVHVEIVEAVLVDVVAGEGPHVLPLDPELLSRDVQPQEHVHGRHAWI